MKKILSLLPVLIALFAPPSARAAPADAKTAAIQQIEAVVEAFRSSLVEKDKARFASLFTPGVGWVGVYTDETLERLRAGDPKRPRVFDMGPAGAKDLIEHATSSKQRIEEKFYEVRIDTDGAVGTVSFDYSFHEGEEKKNWGRELWQMVRTDQGWKIASIVFSITLPAAPR